MRCKARQGGRSDHYLPHDCLYGDACFLDGDSWHFDIFQLAESITDSGIHATPKDFGDFIYHAILPVMCMSLGMSAGLSRQTRTNILDSITQDYIRTARANGLSEGSVVYKHALKNALIPVITIVGMQVRIVVGGSMLVEQLFNIPGLGTLLTTALNNRDYLIVQNCTLLISLFTVAANLLVDIAYGFVDPRIRLTRR